MRLLEGRYDRKILGGKMIRVKAIVEMDEDKIRIRDVGIYGDFFMHPEETIEELERISVMYGFEENVLRTSIRDYLEKGDVEMFGINADDISNGVLDAIKAALILGKNERLRSPI